MRSCHPAITGCLRVTPLAKFSARRVWHNPRWGCGWVGMVTQGGSCLATLGFGTKPRWGIQRDNNRLKASQKSLKFLITDGHVACFGAPMCA
jgi:hypothetical protein